MIRGPFKNFRVRRFARKAKKQKIQISYDRYNYLWTVSPNTKRNRVLLEEAELRGYIRVGLYGRIRYNDV